MALCCRSVCVCVCHRPRCVEVVVFPGRNFPSHRRKKERNIKAKSTETCFLRITFSFFFSKKERRRRRRHCSGWIVGSLSGSLAKNNEKMGTTKGEKRHSSQSNWKKLTFFSFFGKFTIQLNLLRFNRHFISIKAATAQCQKPKNNVNIALSAPSYWMPCNHKPRGEKEAEEEKETTPRRFISHLGPRTVMCFSSNSGVGNGPKTKASFPNRPPALFFPFDFFLRLLLILWQQLLA